MSSYEDGDGDDQDGFDPAFEFHPILQQDGGGLGDFGNELNHLDDNEFNQSNILSSASELHESLHSNSFIVSRHASSSSSTFPFPSDAHTDPDDISSTPLRRTRGSSNGTSSAGTGNASHRLSLAFELASASAPGNSNRDLMRELGIEEDEIPEEDGEGVSEGYEEEEEEEEEEGGKNDSGYGADDLSLVPGSSSPAIHTLPPSPPRLKNLRPRASSSASQASISTFHSYSELHSPNPNQQLDEAHASSFSETTISLETSLAITNVFLSHIRQHNTAIEVPNANTKPKATTPDDFVDRQPVVETLATNVIRSMQDFTKRREQQVRELNDLERLCSTSVRLPDPFPSSPVIDYEEEAEASSSPQRTSDPDLTTTSLSSARLELSNLRDVTSSLITTLSSINELTQVNKAGMGESSRKLKALKAYVVSAKEDLQSLARSEEFVREYEEEERREGRKKGRFSERARDEMKGVMNVLDEGWRRAQEVLAH